jgi:hypothetical protein
MSPEEFDNRLKSSFQDEFLPPKDQLWQNIGQRLDQSAKKPFWYWLVPVIIVVSAGIAWLGNGLINSTTNNNVTVQSSLDTDNTDEIANKTTADNKDVAKDADNTVANNNQASGYEIPQPLNEVNSNANKQDGSAYPDRNTSRNPDGNSNAEQRKPSKTYAANNGSEGGNLTQTDNAAGNIAERPVTRSTPSLIDQYAEVNKLSMSGYPYFQHQYDFQKESLLAFENNEKAKKPETPKKYRSNYNTSDFDSKWWFNFGIGPQLALNSVNVKSDSQAYIHKDLWINRSKMTHNGSGVQARALVSYNFGKRFHFETGLTYGLRTEDIKFNINSKDIAARSGGGRIENYYNLIVWIRIPDGQGGWDTTFYDAVSNFNMSVKNKYHVVTLPFNIRSEHKLSENTFFSASVGGGVSMITSKTSHYDMVREVMTSDKANRTSFTGSLNANLAIYTNFNDIGQIGLYTGFQMYSEPWKVSNGQYAIRMNDLQIGVMFRKPLNWGK